MINELDIISYRVTELEKEKEHSRQTRHKLKNKVSALAFSIDDFAKSINELKKDIKSIREDHLADIESDMSAQKVRHKNNEASIMEIKESQKWQIRFLIGTLISTVATLVTALGTLYISMN